MYISYCITIFDRLHHIKQTFDHNIHRLSSDEQIVLVDYGPCNSFQDIIFQDYRKQISSGNLKYVKINDELYHCSIAKNIAHYYSDGQYLVNLDCDNLIDGIRDAVNKQVSISKSNFILHMAVLDNGFSRHQQKQKDGFYGTFGRICLNKKDFINLGGYNESFMPIAYQDSDILLRAISNGLTYNNIPVYTSPIKHKKHTLVSHLNKLYTWKDCSIFNQNISDNNIKNKKYVADNIKKNIRAKINNEDTYITYSNSNNSAIKYDYFISICGENIIDEFLQYNFLSHEQLIDFYTTYIAEDLMFKNPDLIVKVTEKLKRNITEYAIRNSKTYCEHRDKYFYTRKELDNKESWLSNSVSSNRIIKQHTSGSTTGEKFRFFNDSKYFSYLQNASEFDLILKEYNLYKKPIKILNLFKHGYNPQPENFYLSTTNYSNHKFHSYNAKEFYTYFVNWNGYMDNPDRWHDMLLGFLSDNYFDIVLASGPVVHIMNRYIKKNNFNHKFAYLLSHSTEFAKISDLQFLKSHGNIDYWCDHMRCWDGGASFFTCKYETYHLLDNFSYVENERDNKLISTDYFNLAAPFIRYWNGDLCEIDDNYRLCMCGRHYRPFKMLQNRPFALKGTTKLTEIKSKIKNLPFKDKISQVQFENLNANIYLNSKIEMSDIKLLKDILSEYEVKIHE